MLSGWPIRRKLRLGIVLLAAVILTLMVSGFRGIYAYRRLAKSLSERASELPTSLELVQHVSSLREAIASARDLESVAEANGLSSVTAKTPDGRSTPADSSEEAIHSSITPLLLQANFARHLENVRETFGRYSEQLERNRHSNDPFGDSGEERRTLAAFADCLTQIEQLQEIHWLAHAPHRLAPLENEVRRLYELSINLPSHLHQRMQNLSQAVRYQYRTWIVLNAVTGGFTFLLLALIARLFYLWVLYPLNVLIAGSQRVASGDFKHQIRLNSRDEMSGLADAMNNMVRRFREIRNDLDRKVEERTREVVRSEQLASVGFLAAGVAHEINNPLASIALCAESLEERAHDIMQADDMKPDDEHNEEVTVMRNYLRMIQDEAFRCKQITERLLDFSRLGDMERHAANLTELVSNVIEMIRHVGKYRDKKIEFAPDEIVTAHFSAPEIKQVVLNLITNGLDSLNAGGTVRVRLQQDEDFAELVVEDNGCGMTDEVLEHIFQPFFTRRRDGTGTGLGMSISYRIIQDHGGSIRVHSDGPGRGSVFRVRIPLHPLDKERHHLHYAA